MTRIEKAPCWQAKQDDTEKPHSNISRLKTRRQLEWQRKAKQRIKRLIRTGPVFDPPIKCGLDRRGNPAIRDVEHENIQAVRLLLKDFQLLWGAE